MVSEMEELISPRIDRLGNLHELGIISLMYVSRSSLSLKGDYEVVDDIVRIALSRNAQLHVTGALIYTELHFAQVIEGPSSALGELMESIVTDKRHTDVTVVARHKISKRRFSAWSMAYKGPSPFLDRHVKPLVAAPNLARQGEEMVERLSNNIQRLYGL